MKIGSSLVDPATGQELEYWDHVPSEGFTTPSGEFRTGITEGAQVDGKYLMVGRYANDPPSANATIESSSPPLYNTVEQRVDVTRVYQDHDLFYGVIDSSGRWVPYTPIEMKPRLEQYSSNARLGYETGGVIIAPLSGGNYGASTQRDDRSLYESAYTYLQAAPAGTTATVKLMRVKTVNPPAYGNTLFVKNADLAKLTEIKSATNKWSNLCFAQESTLFDGIEAQTVTTKDQIDAAYLTMRQGAFPVTP